MIRITIIAVFALAFGACNNGSTQKPMVKERDNLATAKDVHTQSNADKISIKHLSLDIQVDFAQQKIKGHAQWDIDNKNNEKHLILDTYDLTIDSVFADGEMVEYTLGTFKEHLGTPLSIPILPSTKQVKIFYSSGSKATALQWLTPTQTYDGKQPFLYTQSESIYARSWIPCPDGPGIRFTYNARVATPKGLMAVMSATNPQVKNDSGVYEFDMDIPIPAYLLALAVGDISFHSLGNRTGVYAEPGMLAKAAQEFSGVEDMVAKAESLYGAYRWGRYDMIVLPPGFPIGGMENPRLTFLTPTIIAGDKSLVNLIAHELAHSWSGNLVTNATWNDFWLNEGFTMYFERRITELMNDKSYVDMQWALGYQDLLHTVEDLGKESKDTHLKLDLAGRDPDEGLTDIAYEKGAHFLKVIEQHVGRPSMDKFLNDYFATHAFKTINTESFLAYLDAKLLHGDSALYQKIKVKEWVYGPGIPSNCPIVQPERFKKVEEAIAMLQQNNYDANSINTNNWSTYEWLHFLRALPKPLSADAMQKLDKKFAFTNTGNSEIANLWLVHTIASGYEPAYAALDQFVSRIGRRKFLEPLYKEMMATGKKDMAVRFFNRYKNNYHPLAQGTMSGIINGK